MKYAKAIVTAIGAIVAVLIVAFGDNVLSMDESAKILATVIEQGMTLFAVWKTPNKGYVYTPPMDIPQKPPNYPLMP